jgi:hypothetical protein
VPCVESPKSQANAGLSLVSAPTKVTTSPALAEYWGLANCVNVAPVIEKAPDGGGGPPCETVIVLLAGVSVMGEAPTISPRWRAR